MDEKAIAGIILAISTLIGGFTKWLVDKIISKREDLEYNPLFKSLWKINNDIKYLRIENKKKKKVIEKFIDYKVKAVYNTYLECAKNLDCKILSFKDFNDYSYQINLINNIITQYNTKALQNGIPQLFIDKFSQFHEPHVRYLKDNLFYICNSKKPNRLKSQEILRVVRNAMDFTFYSAEQVLCKLNGELDQVIS